MQKYSKAYPKTTQSCIRGELFHCFINCALCILSFMHFNKQFIARIVTLKAWIYYEWLLFKVLYGKHVSFKLITTIWFYVMSFLLQLSPRWPLCGIRFYLFRLVSLPWEYFALVLMTMCGMILCVSMSLSLHIGF